MEPRTDAQEPVKRRPRNPNRPIQNVVIFCPEHRVKCKAGHSSDVKTYFYCPVDGCKFSHHELRPVEVFPPSFHSTETAG